MRENFFISRDFFLEIETLVHEWDTAKVCNPVIRGKNQLSLQLYPIGAQFSGLQSQSSTFDCDHLHMI